jgi:hypothetical protein
VGARSVAIDGVILSGGRGNGRGGERMGRQRHFRWRVGRRCFGWWWAAASVA